MEHVAPSVRKTAFNCPHCDALAHQSWYLLGARQLQGKKSVLPPVTTNFGLLQTDFDSIGRTGDLSKNSKWVNAMTKGYPFTEPVRDGVSFPLNLWNVVLSECFHCKKISIWIHSRLVHPRTGKAPPPHPDLPEKIRPDYDEASSILDESPRGAAALIRLAIQKLCKEIGQPGENLNENIAALVKSGLDPLVQQALDAVRVIGNNAVHPGQIDLRDDRATAERLFDLLNVIVERMISVPKHVREFTRRCPMRNVRGSRSATRRTRASCPKIQTNSKTRAPVRHRVHLSLSWRAQPSRAWQRVCVWCFRHQVLVR